MLLKKILANLELASFKPNSIIKALVLTYLVIFSVIFIRYNFNFSAFINIGDKKDHYTYEYLSNEYLSSDVVIFKDIEGYDGSQYFFMAHDPLLYRKNYMESFKKRHFFRYKKRILYPLTVSLLSFDNPKLMAFNLFSVNAVFILLSTYFLSKIIQKYGGNPSLALVYALSSGTMLSLFYDLTEPFAMGFSIMAFYFYEVDKRKLSVLFLSLSLFAKETSILIIWALMINDLVKKRYRDCFLLALSVSPSVFFQIFIINRLSDLNLIHKDIHLQSGLLSDLYSAFFSGAVGFPFEGIYHAVINTSFSEGLAKSFRGLTKFVAIAFVLGCFIVSIKKLFSKFTLYSFTIFFHLIFMIRGYEDLWSTFLNVTRVNSYLFLFLPLSFVEKKDRFSWYLIVLSIGMSILAILKLFTDTMRPFYLS